MRGNEDLGSTEQGCACVQLSVRCVSLIDRYLPFISSFIPACLSGVGLKGAGWTRTENDISTRTT